VRCNTAGRPGIPRARWFTPARVTPA